MASIIAGPFSGVAFGKVLGWVEYYISEQRKYQKPNVRDKLVKLKRNLEFVKLYAANAEIKMDTEKLPTWLSELKNAIYDAEYVMGVFEYERLKNEVDGRSHQTADEGRENKPSSKVNRPWKKKNIQNGVSRFTKSLFFAVDELNELSKVVEKFDELVKTMSKIARIIELPPEATKNQGEQLAVDSSRETTYSLPDKTELFGVTERCQNELLNLLQQSSTGAEPPKFSVVSVEGIGGVGKTTLAQLVFNHPSLEGHFDLRIWVYVGRNFVGKQLMIRIIQNSRMKPPAYNIQEMTLQNVEDFLSEGLRSKKFLLVLDEVWEDMKDDEWQKVTKSFKHVSEGSKVLVTTRSRNIAEHMGAKEKSQIYLSPLQADDCWKCLKVYAFNKCDRNVEEELKTIGEKIAKELGGIPLAAKVVGEQLHMNLNKDEWEKVLDTKAWKKNEKLMSSLKLSYDHLDEHLKKCFLYLSLFPKGYKYNSRTLADIWLTLNCVHKTDGNRRLVEIQRKYAGDLVNRCLMNDSFGERKDEPCYTIHDLLHDLAESIAGNVVYRVEDDESLSKEAKLNVRHLYVESTKSLDYILKGISPKQLRSLIYIAKAGESSAAGEESLEEGKLKCLAGALQKLKGLCLLFFDFKRFHLQKEIQIPNNLGDLVHLRCINLNLGQENFIIPESFWKLYQLEILQWHHTVIKKCNHLNKLVSLRFVHNTKCSYNDPNIITSYLGYLKFLEVVPGGNFIVDEKAGNDIGQLEKLNKIGGELILTVNVKLSKANASKADLGRKEYLTGLTIDDQCHKEIEGIETKAIEALEPHTGLKQLIIRGSKSITAAPEWLPMLSKLTKLILSNLPNLQGLSRDLGSKLLSLKYLHLISLPSVKQIDVDFSVAVDGLFPSLLYIKLNCMENLEGWSCCSNQTTRDFPKLFRIEIEDCPKLLTRGNSPNGCIIFPFPGSAKCRIRIEHSGDKKKEEKVEEEEREVEAEEEMRIEMVIDDKTLLPAAAGDNNEPKTSEFFGCFTEMVIKDSGRHFMAMMKRLLHTNLKQLEIRGSKSITVTPDWLPMLSKLTKLVLSNLPKLQGLSRDLGRKLLCLKYLHLISLPLVKLIDVDFSVADYPSLLYIELNGMENLEGWSCDRNNQTTRHFPRLFRVKIEDCPKLLTKGDSANCIIFPFRSSENRRIRIDRTGDEEVEAKAETEEMSIIEMVIDKQTLLPAAADDDHNELKTSTFFSSFTEIVLTDFGQHFTEMMTLLKALSRKLSALEVLKIECCLNLESLDDINIAHNRLLDVGFKIKKLVITSSTYLKFLPVSNCISLQLFSSVDTLVLKHCKNLDDGASVETLLNLQAQFPSLETLIVQDCKLLESLVGLSAVAKTLILRECKNINFSLFQHLETLIIEDCCGISLRLQTASSTLNRLIIIGCTDSEFLSGSSPFPLLKMLIKKDCRNIALSLQAAEPAIIKKVAGVITTLAHRLVTKNRDNLGEQWRKLPTSVKSLIERHCPQLKLKILAIS